MLLRCALCLICISAFAARVPAADTTQPAPRVVELFDAAKSGEIQVTLIARDAKHASVQLHNPTDAPLVVRTPSVILAQPRPIVPAIDRFRDDEDEKKEKQPQMIGMPFPQGPWGQRPPQVDMWGRQNQQNQFQRNPFDGPNGFFNVPAGKTVRLKLTAVCLQYGRRDPNPRVVYDIKRFEDVVDKPEVRKLLEGLGTGKYEQTEAQIAAWHWTEGMSWRELADVKIRYMNGQERRRFRRREVESARRIAERLEEKVRQIKEQSAKVADSH